jgi:hypothetical protein
MKNKLSDPPFVWTEIGRKPGRYVLNAININSELFPNSSRFLILSREFASNLSLKDCLIIEEEELSATENSIDFKNTPKDWNWSQVNYWTNTTRRFFVLEQFLESYKLDKLIHLESDNVLLDRKFIDDLFQKSNWGVKYTKQDHSLGCASVFLVNSRNELSEFNRFVINNWKNPIETDMTLLSKYLDYKNENNYLPSGDLIDTNTVFDAGTIGRFYLGGDARNNRIPYSTRGILPTTQEFFDPSKYQVKLKNNSIRLINSSKNDLLLACIHIHSKRIPGNANHLFKMVVREANAKRNWRWRTGVIDLNVLIERINSFLRRRVLRDKSTDPRVR